MTPYHHGDLRAALLAAAEERVRRDGAAGLSLREVARDAGVSHAAPAHHFGSRRGLLTALAAQGHELLAAGLDAAADAGGPEAFAAAGVAYVRFAVEHPAHFAVMFDPTLVDVEDPVLAAARAGTLARLAGDPGRDAVTALAGWSLVHGLAVLHGSGNLAAADVRGVLPADGTGEPDVVRLARDVVGAFGPRAAERD